MSKHTAPSRVNAETSDVPIARLDVQDIEQALAIREYLERNGCAVVVNRKPAVGEKYHIICGGEEFVQATIASTPQKATKLFVVLFLGNNKNIPESLQETHIKIAVVSGTTISTRDINPLFAYFFTDEDNIFYLHNSAPPMVAVKAFDKDRVSRGIGEMLSGLPHVNQTRNIHMSLLAIGIMVAPLIWYIVSLTIIASVQWYGVSALKKGNVTRAGTIAGLTTYWLGQGKGALAVIGFPVRLFGQGPLIRSEERVLSIIGDVAEAQTKVAQLVTQSNLVTPRLFVRPDEARGGEVSLAVAIEQARLALDGLTNSLGLAGAQLRLIESDGTFPFTISFVKRMTERAEVEINSALSQAGAMRNLLALYRATGGFDEKKTYLILLQNSMELRPTGGFIGSIAIMTIADGVIETPVVQDVYAIDGQLKGHVDPPGPMKELLKQEHWYLRDSNWDPDFVVSGEQAAWFYQKETGVAVDGVVAVSTPVLTELLAVTGPIDLPDYNDRITAENFFGKSLFYTKADFFPGSTQKKDFLGSLMVALLGRITSRKPGDASGLAQVASRALGSGDIQFWFGQREAQAIAEQAGWAGTLTEPLACQREDAPCTVQRVGLVEANLGVNKVNAFISRSIKARVDIDEDGAIDGTIAVVYRNTSTDDASLGSGGTYLAYLRVLVPADALIVSATMDGVEIPGKATSLSAITTPYRDADEIIGGSAAVAALAFTVPPGRGRSVMITYHQGIPMTFTDGQAAFVYTMRKQPGIVDTPMDIAIGYPAGWSTDAATETFANIREVRYNTVLDATKTFIVKFHK
ncbi:DUF4012 domain-containing protein [Candidatus Gottesmanbacteria bacterium]|nr:DUF4012 domain-containing protein [Candidatus Gottesmanbacteria bacterium]